MVVLKLYRGLYIVFKGIVAVDLQKTEVPTSGPIVSFTSLGKGDNDNSSDSAMTRGC